LFTGIVEGLGHVESIAPHGNAYRIAVDLAGLSEGVAKGDSIAVDGTCLTAVVVRRPKVEFDVVRETVERTAFAQLRVGDRVNVERSMAANGRFHGHVVAGHVDGTGRIVEKRLEPAQTWITVEVPKVLSDQMIFKGSVALDGVSLTLAALTEKSFSVAVIPHTLAVTTLGVKGVGALVNIEVDCMGKWIRKAVETYLARGAVPEAPAAPASVVLPPSEALGLTFEDLRRFGFGSPPS
jgi:riboflavin synthase